MIKTIQDKILGEHPPDSNIFGEWLVSTDLPETPNKKHRELKENKTKRNELIKKLSFWIIKHHIIEDKIKNLKIKNDLLEKNKYLDYFKGKKLLPKFDDEIKGKASKTQKGNAAEILFLEYLVAASKMNISVYKLRFNPNVDQSMKGDDVLLHNEKLDTILIGESKFVSDVDRVGKKTIEDIASNLAFGKIPLSLGFIETILYTKGETELADKISDLETQIHEKKIKMNYAGFLMSTKAQSPPSKDTSYQVETHLNSSNPNLIFISLGLDDPEEIIFDSFKMAYDHLVNVENIPIETDIQIVDTLLQIFKKESWQNSTFVE